MNHKKGQRCIYETSRRRLGPADIGLVAAPVVEMQVTALLVQRQHLDVLDAHGIEVYIAREREERVIACYWFGPILWVEGTALDLNDGYIVRSLLPASLP
jgi:hypothetical protein